MARSSKASRLPKNACALYSRSARLEFAPQERPAEVVSEQQPFRQERLESLLNTIKQDLNQLVRK